jgi:DNA-binding beta-propeller fold protein YncE
MKLCHSEGQEIIAVDKIGQQVLFLDPADLSIRASIKHLPSRPHELLVLEKQRKAYVPIYGDGVHGDNPHPNHQIAVIDLDDRALSGFIDTAPYVAPHTGRLASDGLVYLCCEDSATVLVIDPQQDRIIDHITLPSSNVHRLTPLPNAREVYTESEEDGLLSVIELGERGATVVANIRMPGTLNGVDASPQHPIVVATSSDEPSMYVIDTDQRCLTRTLPLSGHRKCGQIVRFSPDGRLLAVIGDFEPVVSFYDEHLNPLFTAQLGEKPLDGCFSPAMDYLLVANEKDATISVVDLHAQRTIGHVPVGEGCEILAYFNR